MDFFPIFLKLQDQPCAVIGGGSVAARKVELLLAAGAQVTITAPLLCEELTALNVSGKIRHHVRTYSADALEGVVLVIAATNDRTVNARVSSDARSRHMPVNVVDDPALCSFIVPAIVDRSPVVIAVSTGGASPVLARLTRARLESLIPFSYGALARLADRFRERVKAALPAGLRRGFWERSLQGPVADLVLSGREQEAETLLEKALHEAAGSEGQAPSQTGEVFLVGAGPGNPDLLTFAALRLMQQADVVLYDNLVSPEILALVRRDAERIYVGKRSANHSVRQTDINRMLVEHARAGRKALRLKGGDPYVFGRGAEEIATLAAEGIRFQVIPGVTAATGAASYAGIPLTHRDHAHSCLFVTGHLRDGQLDLNWTALTQPQQTVVIYMGLPAVAELCKQLIAHGKAAETPAALVSRATLSDQCVLTGTLASLPDLVASRNPPGPTLIIVGETVSLAGQLGWCQVNQ